MSSSIRYREATLGELCELVRGNSPITKTNPGEYTFVTTAETHRTADSYQFDCEAVCIPLISSTGHGHASIKRIHYAEGKFALANLMVAAVVKDSFALSSRYLAYYLSFNKDRLIVPLMTGAANMSLSVERLATVPVRVPSLDEQLRTVELLTEIQELGRLRARADQKSAELGRSIYHDMFEHHFAGSPVQTASKVDPLPENWRWMLLTDVATLASGHTPSRKKPEYWNGDIPWISLSDIRRLDGNVANETEECVTELGIAKSSSVKLPAGTVCLSRTASVGFVTVMGREMATSQDFVNWVCSDQIDPMFLMGSLIQAREHLRSLASGSIHKTIYFPTVQKFHIVLPPIDLQRKYASRISQLREIEGLQRNSRDELGKLEASMFYQRLTSNAMPVMP